MAALLRQWLQDIDIKDANAIQFEKDLSNGYIYAQILHKYGFYSDLESFNNSSSSQGMVQNYKQLQKTLSSIGVVLTSRMSLRIMQEEPGT